MQQFARTTTAVLVLCLLLPACMLDSGDKTQPVADTPMLLTPDMKYNKAMAVVNSAPRYGGPGPESEGMVYFDAETFYREWEAWKALGLTGYTYKMTTWGNGHDSLREEVEAAGNSAVSTVLYAEGLSVYNYHTSEYLKRRGMTIDQMFENFEQLNKNHLETVQNGEAGKRGKYGIEISYDPQYHYPVLSVVLNQAEYRPHCFGTWWNMDNGFEVVIPFCAVCKVKAEQGDRNYQWFPTYLGWEITSFQPMD